MGDRSFYVAAPTLWNSMTEDLRGSQDIKHFKKISENIFIYISF